MFVAKILLFCILATTTCAARGVKVRLLNGETGAPIAGKEIDLWTAKEWPSPGSWVDSRLKAGSAELFYNSAAFALKRAANLFASDATLRYRFPVAVLGGRD